MALDPFLFLISLSHSDLSIGRLNSEEEGLGEKKGGRCAELYRKTPGEEEEGRDVMLTIGQRLLFNSTDSFLGVFFSLVFFSFFFFPPFSLF